MATGRYPIPCGSITTADVNNDGHLDIVDCTGAVLLGRGNGTFTSGVGSAIPPNSQPVIADFNGDGNMDLLFLRSTSQYPLPILLGNGDGTFQPPAPAGPSSLGSFFGLSDFNSDGHLAVVGSGQYGGISAFVQVPAGLYPGTLTYGQQVVGTSSSPQTANLYNAGGAPLTLKSIQIGGTDPNDFSQTNNCPTSVPVGGGCQIQVTFTPTAAGNRQAALNIAYIAFRGTPISVSVSLTGQGMAVVSVSLTPSNLTFDTELVKKSSHLKPQPLPYMAPRTVTINSISVRDHSARPTTAPRPCPSDKAAKFK